MKFISFHIPNCSLYLIIISIIRTINDIITNNESTRKYFDNPLFYNFLMYIGESLSLFLYLYQKIINKIWKQDNSFQYIKERKNFSSIRIILFFGFIIFICSFTDFLASFEFSYYYSYKMQKINVKLIENFSLIVLFISYYLVETYFLNIKSYIHHFIGIGINIIPLIIILLYYFITMPNLEYNLSALLCLLIINLQINFLQTICLTIPKKLNYEYFINMNLILFIEGIFGILMILIYQYCIYIFKNAKIDFDYREIKYSSICDIIILIIYCILICILNILLLKVVEETRPIYNSLSKGLSNIFIDISHLIQYFFLKNNDYKDVLDFKNIILKTFALIGFLIYSEIITLNFCDLDKFTKKKTADRGEEDSREMSCESIDVINKNLEDIIIF